jgi:lipopolysaccharide transport system ATP-binding protein
MEHVYKKFRRGEMFNSLRDFLPAMTGRMFRQQDLSARDEREFWALQDLCFEVKWGESLGIIGRNGAGKSTALKILSRIMKPTKGSMSIHGRLSALIEVSAGFHQDLTGRENIFLNGSILGMSRREIESKLDQIIAFSGIEEFIDTPVKRYSSGMYARLGFSVAAHVDPDILIVDEVLSVGDYMFQQKCITRMREVLRSGAAVLFVSHNLKSVAEFCQRCLLLDKGRTVMTGQSQEVISAYLDNFSGENPEHAARGAVWISRAIVRNDQEECLRFHPGERAWVDVEVRARERCSRLSVSLTIFDESLNTVFDVSTERMGHGNFSLDSSSLYRCTFELDLNLTRGVYHLAVLVKRYDTSTEYDRLFPAAVLYMSAEDDVRGSAHCFPRLTLHEVRRAEPTTDSRESHTAAGGKGRVSD